MKEAALKQEGVIGSRMTGAGFLGGTVSLVMTERVEAFIEKVGKDYKEQMGYDATFYVVEIEALHPKARFYKGDIRDKTFLHSVFEKETIDAVIHLETMLDHGINKIVFSSTAATYGEPQRIPILETDPTIPTNAYGETKLAMEKRFKWADWRST